MSETTGTWSTLKQEAEETHKKGKKKEAVVLYQQALKTAEVESINYLDIIKLKFSYGRLLLDLRKIDEAKIQWQEAVDLYNNKTQHTAQSFRYISSELTWTYMAFTKLEKYRNELKYFYNLILEMLEDDPESLSKFLDSAAGIHYKIDKKTSEELFDKSITILKEEKGENDPSVLYQHVFIATSYSGLNEPQKSKEHLLSAFNIWSKNKEDSLSFQILFGTLSLYYNKHHGFGELKTVYDDLVVDAGSTIKKFT